jgi:hypothetical protein
LAHWLAGKVLIKTADKIVKDTINEWCIAKLVRLAGPLGASDPSKTDIVEEFHLAESFEKENFVHPKTGPG